jgi:hypothetical protein
VLTFVLSILAEPNKYYFMKKYYILLTGAILAATIQTQAQTKIGGTGAPDPSAMLEVTGGTGNNKGILPPRLTTAQRDAMTLPATGLMIYNTTANQLQVNTGTPAVPIWSIATNSNSWNTNGNAGTSSANNFIGTTDNQSLLMRTNNAERLRIDTIGRIGIGDATPRAPLSFASTIGPKIRLYDNNTDTLTYGFGVSSASLNYHIQNGGNAAHRFWAGGSNGDGTQLMQIGNDGNVGIGTNAPLVPLSFASTDEPKIALYDNGSTTQHYGLGVSGAQLNYQVMNGGTHSFRAGGKNADGTELMRIQSNGNIGVGTAVPAAKLDVNGTARINGSAGTPTTITGRSAAGDIGNVAIGTGLSLTGGTLSATAPTPGWALGGNAGTNGAINYIGTTDAQPLVLRTNAIEHMRIGNNGNVGISNSAPLSPLSFASTVGSKIALYDGGSAIDYFGLGISINMLDYHVMPNGVHAFFAGGKNGDGTELMRIQSDGKVGISNNAPLVPLAFASSVGAKISLYDGGNATDNFGFGIASNTLAYHVVPGGVHSFFAGGKAADGTELMRIQGDGNVGIGTTAPVAKLDVNGTARIAGSAGTPTDITGRDASGNISNITLGANLSLAGGVLSATGGGTTGWGLTGNSGTSPAANFMGTTDAQPLVVRTNNTERMRILNDGRVGIGTSTPSPTSLLDVDSGYISLTSTYGLHWGNDPLGERIYTYWNLGGPTGNSMFMEAREHMVFIADRNNSTLNSNSIGFIWATNGSWLNGGTPSEWMRLTDIGRLGIGTSSPDYKLDVVGDINASNTVRAGGVILTSDARLKRNISNTQHGLSTIMKLNPVEYEKKNTIQDSVYDRHEIGFIAQEVAKVLPNLITEGKDADKTLAVSYTELIPVLTKAIQELNTQVETLKTENNELKENKAVTAQLMERVKQMEQMMGIKEIEGTSKVAGK